MQTQLNTHIMQLSFTTHNMVGEDTLGGILNKNTAIKCNFTERMVPYEDWDEVPEETFTFSNEDPKQVYKDLAFFLTQIPSYIAGLLVAGGGDDTYFDYLPSLMEQYRELLIQCQDLELQIRYIPDPKTGFDNKACLLALYQDEVYRATKINIDFFNAMLHHQAGDEDCDNPLNWFNGGLEPIEYKAIPLP